MTFRIEHLKSVLKDDIPELPKNICLTIQKAIHERLVVDPISFGKPLRGSYRGYYRLRVGDYRVIYRIENYTTVLIVRIRHRKDVYH